MFVTRFILIGTGNIFMSHSLKNNIRHQLPFFLALLAGVAILFGRCANQGMPTGGPRDSIPPVLLESVPEMSGINFSGKEVRLTFDEFIIPDRVSEELVVSPPLTKRPGIRTKSRSLIVTFNEELKKGVTYSLDFKNSVVDNNEQNPYPRLRMLFSTGDVIDTLRVAGMVKKGHDLEPQEKILVMLHSNLNDTAVTASIPDYVAKTDDRGLFLFDNIKPGTYNLFAVNDANNNLKYDAGAEEFAFCDSLIIPSAEFTADPDTLAIGADSLLIAGHTQFKPDPVYLRTFTEKFYDQFLDKSVRDNRYKCTFVFGESVKDTLAISLQGREIPDWYTLEYNPAIDSLTLWITDTLVARMDTLKMELAYFQLDSMKQKYLHRDTVSLTYTGKEVSDTRRRKKDDETPRITQFTLTDNIKSTGFDLNTPIRLQTPEPAREFDFSAIRLTLAEDSTATPLKISPAVDTTEWRSWLIDFPWEPSTGYVLEIDSAACKNIYGITNQKFKKQFVTQADDFYGRIILNFTAVKDTILVQLLDNSKEEKVLRTLKAFSDGKVTFDFLAPAKYKVKIIFDTNNNGKWDPGIFSLKQQSERVGYLPEIVKVRSNWDNQYEWDLKPDPTFRKVLIDKEEEEKKRKEMQEQQRRDAEMERQSPDSNFGMPAGFP